MANVFFTAPGAAVMTILHTVGALAFLGGLIAWVSWARAIRGGDHHPNILALGASLAYVGIVANLVGGFVRTYQPGHGSLFAVGTDPWVTMMVAKHVALFAGIGAAVYLFEIVAPRLRRAWGSGQAVSGRPGRVAASVVSLSIILASILGAAAAVLPMPTAPEAEDEAHGGPPRAFGGAAYPFSGSTSAGGTDSGSFEVPAQAVALEAVLHASPVLLLPTPFEYTLVLIAPGGARRTETSSLDPAAADPDDPLAGRSVRISVDGPSPGTWGYEVRASGAEAGWSLVITLMGPEGLVLEDEAVLQPGQFFEINLEGAEGEMLSWNWSADAVLDFNVHTHFGGDVQYPVQYEADHGRGNHTTDRDGGISIMWSNDTDAAITLAYRVWGPFTLHSVYRS